MNDTDFARRASDVRPADPMTAVLYEILPALSKSGDLTGLRRLWGAIAAEFRATFPTQNPKAEHNVESYRDEAGRLVVHPYETVFRLGWQVAEHHFAKGIRYTGRRVRQWDAAALGGPREVMVRESTFDNAELHAAFLRVIARFNA